jgi:hypothetical protein
MKQLFFTLLLFLSWGSFSQEEFSFTLYFEDAVGNRDSLILGYDENGTQFLDEQFGEVDISNEPWDSVFEVRASELYIDPEFIASPQSWIFPPPQFMSKKQIIEKCECCHSDVFFSLNSLGINVKSNNYPLKITWDSGLFETDSCLMGTHLSTNVYTMVPHTNIPLNLANGNMPFESWYSSEHSISPANDTINVLYFTFSKPHPLSVNDKDDEKSTDFKLYPNPTSDKLYFEINNPSEVKEIEIIDLLGRVKSVFTFQQLKSNDFIPVSDLNQGRYFLKIYSTSGVVTKQFIKL